MNFGKRDSLPLELLNKETAEQRLDYIPARLIIPVRTPGQVFIREEYNQIIIDSWKHVRKRRGWKFMDGPLLSLYLPAPSP